MRHWTPTLLWATLVLPALSGCGRHALAVPDASLDERTTLESGVRDALSSDGASLEGGVRDALSSNNADAGATGCSAVPTKIIGPFWLSTAPDGGAPWSLGDVAVGAGSLYLVGDDGASPGLVWRIPLEGGSASVLAQTLGLEEGLLSTPTGVVLAETAISSDGGLSGKVVLLPYDATGGPTTLATTTGNIVGLAADSASVYVADAAGTWRAPLAGGTRTLLTPRVGTLGLFADDVVIADADASEILTVPTGSGALTTLASGQPHAIDPIACGSALCWMTAGDVVLGEGTASLVRLAVPAPPVAIASSADLFPPEHLAFDGEDFFVAIGADAVPTGPVEEVPSAGGTPTPVPNVMTVRFALDDHCLYWTDPQNGVFVVAVGQ